MALDRERLKQGLNLAFDAFLDRYAILGGHGFHGFAGYGDDRNYQGPMLWSEGDCQFQLALELERQFPGMVHVETPIARFNARPWDKDIDRRQFIDIVVSDLSGFDVERDVFATHQHALFVEVKYVGHSSSFVHKSLQTIRSGVSSDLERLKRNLERPRCAAAAMLLIDDNSHLEHLDAPLPWDPRIWPLLASPAQLTRRKRAAQEFGVTLPLSCPKCGSPRVEAVSGHQEPRCLDCGGEAAPDWIAWTIMSGDGTIAKKREQLEQLLDQFPMNWTIGNYLGDLDVEEDLERIKAGGTPLE